MSSVISTDIQNTSLALRSHPCMHHSMTLGIYYRHGCHLDGKGVCVGGGDNWDIKNIQCD